MKIFNKKFVFMGFYLFILTVVSSPVFADQISDVYIMTPCMKGVLTYYVGKGDKVKKGDPLFLVTNIDNDPSLFFAILHDIKFYQKVYERRKTLLKTRAVSQEDYDTALNNLINAKDQLISFLCKFKLGFYTAPFDCEVVELMYPNGSGIKDGYTALTIKPIEKNFVAKPVKVNPKIVQILTLSDELVKQKIQQTKVEDVQKLYDKVSKEILDERKKEMVDKQIQN